VWRAQSRLISPRKPRDRARLASLLADAGTRNEGNPGPTRALRYRLGSECVGGLNVRALRNIIVGAYIFSTMINETTSIPRLASPASTDEVETCHPLGLPYAAVPA